MLVQFIKTRILKEIIDSKPYYISKSGIEYHDYVDEIQEVLSKRTEKKVNQELKEYCNAFNASKEFEAAILGNAKYCEQCQVIKPLSEFYKRTKNSNKFRKFCKRCEREKRIPF